MLLFTIVICYSIHHLEAVLCCSGPDPPSIVEGLCNVVLWGQPLQANGRIIRYEVQFYIAPDWFGNVISKSVQPVYHRVQDGDIRSNLRRSEVSVRVSK